MSTICFVTMYKNTCTISTEDYIPFNSLYLDVVVMIVKIPKDSLNGVV